MGPNAEPAAGSCIIGGGGPCPTFHAATLVETILIQYKTGGMHEAHANYYMGMEALHPVALVSIQPFSPRTPIVLAQLSELPLRTNAEKARDQFQL
jgi:hypothetical protein